MSNVRALAAQCCFSVVDQGKSLSEVLPQAQQKISAKDHGLLQEICYGVLRYLPQLEFAIQQLMDKPLVKKQRPVHFLLLVGIYQLNFMRIPDHAAVAETVNGCKALKVNQLTKLVNAILRSYLRQKTELEEAEGSDAIHYCHPSWFIKKIQAAYPKQWQQILDANMQKPPMWLRVNQQKITVTDYQQLLEQQGIKVATVNPHTQAICLAKPCDVTKLANFAEGYVSVQDGAAQYAAILLAAQNDENVLDCCAAPGGKTCHILEQAPQAKVTAIDIESHRLQRVQENLTRLNLTAEVITADASDNSWHDGQLFDRILLDAPCSATGVIRRHPDIKWLRKANDIAELASLQQKILANMWHILKPGGRLVYATCSVLPEENSEQITQFLAKQKDAKLVTIPFAEPTQIGWQILPEQQQMDGFYYAVLEKQP